MFALVASCYRLGVEAQLLEAGLPLNVLTLHHQVLHAVNKLEMHILYRAPNNNDVGKTRKNP